MPGNQQMANMPPEQRQKFEAMMAKQGVPPGSGRPPAAKQ